MPDAVGTGISRIVLVSVVPSSRFIKSDIQTSQAKLLSEDRVIGATSHKALLKPIAADNGAEGERTVLIGLGHFRVGTPEECSSTSRTSSFQIEKSMCELSHRVADIALGSIQAIFFAAQLISKNF